MRRIVVLSALVLFAATVSAATLEETFDQTYNVQPGAQIDPVMKQYADAYAKVRHTVAKAGEKVAVGGGLDWRVVSGEDAITFRILLLPVW